MAGRGAFGSRIGFVMAAVGSAVGLGNLWRFPYLASTNGGASFLVLYVVLLFLIGIPALMAELSLGRRSQRNAVGAFDDEGRHRPWAGAGFLALGAAVLLLSYYSVIAGWALRYWIESLTAPYFGDAAGHFADIAFGPGALLFHALFMIITVWIVIRGVNKGIERANLIMMPILFVAVIALVVYGNMQDGAAAGRAFYLEPNFGEITGGTVSNAAGQTFFSIGLGIGTMLTYSSYLSRQENLQQSGLTIALADTGVAVLAGFMVFPLIFSLGLSDLVGEAGASTVGGLFVALPTAFGAIGGTLGGLLAGSFFLLLTFAALSSAISLLEVPSSYIIDRTAWGRPRSVILMGLGVYILGVPAAFSADWLTYTDAFISRIVLILGGLLLVLYVGWVRKDVLDELHVGVGRGSVDAGRFLKPIIRYPLPLALFLLTILGILGFLHDVGWLALEEGSVWQQIIA